MAPNKKRAASSDIYTAVVALATASVLATAAYIAIVNYMNYGSVL